MNTLRILMDRWIKLEKAFHSAMDKKDYTQALQQCLDLVVCALAVQNGLTACIAYPPYDTELAAEASTSDLLYKDTAVVTLLHIGELCTAQPQYFSNPILRNYARINLCEDTGLTKGA